MGIPQAGRKIPAIPEKTHIHTQPFYSSLHFVQDNPGELVPEGTFCHLLDFWCKMKITHQQSGWTATPSRVIGAPTSAIFFSGVLLL